LLEIIVCQRHINLVVCTIIETVVLVEFFIVPLAFSKKFLIYIKGDLEAKEFSKVITGKFISSKSILS